MKLPNGYGSISKVKGKRRKPWRIYVTLGWDDNGKQLKKSLGYAKDQKDALRILAEYHGDPYNLDYKNITFSYVWENDVIKELETLVSNEKMSNSNLKSLSLAYKNHCKRLYNDKLLEIKFKKLQEVVDESNLGHTAKGNIKTVCVKIFNSAIDKYELPIKNNPAIRLYVGEREDSTKHIPFTEAELNTLWDMSDDDLVKTLLIFSYTGARPNEIFNINRNDVFINESYMRGGSKTKAGKNRVIPIHPRIKPLIEYFLTKEGDYPFKSIIDDFNYGKYERRISKLMEDLNFEHTPYDGRHTFSTRMKKANADQYLLKRIMGHSIQDITEKVYTHRELEELINEVKKIT